MKVLKLVLLVAVALSSTACHARFKKFARTADMVDVRVIVSGNAQVDLAESGGNQTGTFVEAVMDTAVGTAAQIESGKVRQRLQKALGPAEVRQMVEEDVVTLLGDGPPFASGGTPVDGTIQVELLSYGIAQSGGGPQFFVNYRIRGYRAGDGKRIYKHSVSCADQAFHTPNTPGNLLGTAVTIDHLNKMSDEELRQTIEAVVQRCTGNVVADMRRHAG